MSHNERFSYYRVTFSYLRILRRMVKDALGRADVFSDICPAVV